MAILEQARKHNNPVNSRIQFEFGIAEKHAAMAGLGWRESLGSVAWAAYKKREARKKAIERGERAYSEDPSVMPSARTDREVFERTFPGLDFRVGEYPGEAELRYQEKLKEKILARKVRGINPITGFVAGMVGGMANPLDLAVSAVPYVGLGKLGAAATTAVRTGRLGAEATTAMKTGNSLSWTNKILSAVQNSDKATRMGVPKTMRGAFADVADPSKLKELSFSDSFFAMTKAGMTEQIITNGAVYYGSQYVGRDYGALDFAADMVFGGVLHSAFAAPATLKLQKMAKAHSQVVGDRHMVGMFIRDNSMGGVLNILQKYDARVTEAIVADPRVDRVMSMTESEKRLPENRGILDQFLLDNLDTMWVKELKGIIHGSEMDKRLSHIEGRAQEHAEIQTILEAVKRGEEYLLPEDLRQKAMRADDVLRQSMLRAFRGPEGEPPKAKLDLGEVKIPTDIQNLIDFHEKVRRGELDLFEPKSKVQQEYGEAYKEWSALYARSHELKKKGQALSEGQVKRQKELYNKISEVEENYRANILEPTRQIISDIVGIPLDEIKLSYNTSAFGFYTHGDFGKVSVAPPQRFLGVKKGSRRKGAQKHPFTNIFHESMHMMFELDPEARVAVMDIISNDAELVKSMLKHVSHYKDGQQLLELPALLLEGSVQRKAFWDELYKRNSSTYQKLKLFLQKMLKQVQKLIDSDVRYYGFKLDAKTSSDPDKIAAELGAFFREYQMSPEILKRKQEGIPAQEMSAEHFGQVNYMVYRLKETQPHLAKWLDYELDTLRKGLNFGAMDQGAVSQRAMARSESTAPEGAAQKIDQAATDMEKELEADRQRVDEENRQKSEQRAKEVQDKAAEAQPSMDDPLTFSRKQIDKRMRGPLGDYILGKEKNLDELDEKRKALNEAEELTDDHRELIKDASKAKRRFILGTEQGLAYLKSPEQQVDPQIVGEDVARRVLQLRGDIESGRMSQQEADVVFQQWMETNHYSEQLRTLVNFHAVRRLDMVRGKAPKTRLKSIKTFMDGLSRKGVDLKRGSVAADRNAQIAQDQYEFHKVLVEEGMVDIFEAHTSELDHMPPAFKEAYEGAKRLDMSNQFVIDLMYRSKSGETPAHWKENSAVFEKVWKAWDNVTKSQIAQLNELGAGIHLRKGHSNISTRFDSMTIMQMGSQQFHDKMMTMVDWDETSRMHGGVLAAEVDDNGFAKEFTKFSPQSFIQAMYAEATTPTKPADHSSNDIARSFGKARKVVFKDTHEVGAILEFSGNPSLGRLFLDQMRHRSEMIAVARNLGNNPLENVASMMKRHGIVREVNTTRAPEGTILDRLALKAGASFARQVHQIDFDHTISEAKFLTGALDNPANYDVSYWGKTVRSLSHILFLPMSGISAISDMSLTMSTLNQMGIDTNIVKVAHAMKKSASRRFHGDQRKTDVWLQGSGAAFDAMLNAGARRMAIQEGGPDNLINKGAEAMFSLNGLNQWTRIMQEAFVDILSQDLARQAKSGKFDSHTRHTLMGFGITRAQLDGFSARVQATEDGVERLGPPNFADDPELQRALLQYFSHFRDEAIMVPDVGTQAAVRFGTQAGTLRGEAIRTLLQYQSFPLAMNRITGRKFLINNRGLNPMSTGQVTMGNMMTFMGSLLALSYLATALKDLARGREPMTPADMSAESTIRVINQSGIGGMLQSMLSAGTGDPSSLTAPLPNMMFDMTLGSEGVGDTVYAARPMYGANLPLVGTPIMTILAKLMPDMIGANMAVSENFIEQTYGTPSLPLMGAN